MSSRSGEAIVANCYTLTVTCIPVLLTACVAQVADALSYLHNVERLVHLNISPQCVVVTRKGMWKLIGLGFAQTWTEPGQQVRLMVELHCEPKKRGSTFVIITLEKHTRFL